MTFTLSSSSCVNIAAVVCLLSAVFHTAQSGGITRAVLDHEISQLSPDCQQKYTSCFNNTRGTQSLMDQSKFCQALTSVKGCVLGGSSLDICAYKGVKGVACLTGEEAAMADVAMRLPKDCYKTLGNCTSAAAERTLEKEHKYCKFITYSDKSFSVHDCVLEGGRCSQRNYDDVRQAVCGAQRVGLVSVLGVVVMCLSIRALL